MNDKIVHLRSLQAIDDRVRDKVRERDAINQKISSLRKILDQGAGELEEKRERLAEAEKYASGKRDEVQQLKDTAKRLQARLGSIKKTREFNAAQREIESHKKSLATRTEELDKLTEELSLFRQTVEAAEAELEERRKEVASEEEGTSSELASLDKVIGGVAEERAAVEANLPGSVLRKYKRIASRRDGVGIVEARDGQCMGCNRQIPPQLRNHLLKQLRLETCPFCSRFIYAPDDEIERYTAASDE